MINEYASQIEFIPNGRGFVKVLMHNRDKEETVYCLHYAEQGTLVGEPPVDVANARRLNEAATALNETLRNM